VWPHAARGRSEGRGTRRGTIPRTAARDFAATSCGRAHTSYRRASPTRLRGEFSSLGTSDPGATASTGDRSASPAHRSPACRRASEATRGGDAGLTRDPRTDSG
jgi:hypothetical protein